jgi:three-Cys-motif partner protein
LSPPLRPNSPDQFSIFDIPGCEPLAAAKRPPKPMQKEYVSKDGQKFVPVPGYESLVMGEDGLVTRLVHTHSKKKARKVGFYAHVVSKGMAFKWGGRLWWIEFHSGPGQLFEIETCEVLPGSPLSALDVPTPFAGYVFVEFDPLCADSLRKRTAAFRNVTVVEGDANSPEVLDRIRATVPTSALAVFYADPEDLDDFDFETIKFITARYAHPDWLINFPTSGVVRYLTSGGDDQRAVSLLDMERPAELVAVKEGRTWGPQVSTYFQRRLEALGYTCNYEPIHLDSNNVPIYDLFIATKDTTGRALDFFDKACGIRADGQRPLFEAAS